MHYYLYDTYTPFFECLYHHILMSQDIDIINNPERLDVLLSRGYTFSLGDDYRGYTLLHYLVLHNAVRALDIALKYTTNIDEFSLDKGNDHITINTTMAYHHGNEESRLNGMVINVITPLQLAAVMGRYRCVKKLLQHSANKDIKCKLGLTARDYALIGSNMDIAHMLL